MELSIDIQPVYDEQIFTIKNYKNMSLLLLYASFRCVVRMLQWRELIVLTAIEERKRKIDEIAKRATLRKANPNLRHIPNENDVRIASEHTRLMIYHQYQTITSHEEENT